MNDNNIPLWNKSAWLLLEELPGKIAAPLRGEWNELAQHDKLVVMLFGPYGTGKSSLLKRLCLDEYLTVPDWLTISARRETFETNEAEVCGVIVRDTPGVSGGNTVHEAATEAALLETDALVVMLPPQLVTGDAQAAAVITSVLNGSHYHCESEQAFAPGSLLLVIARMDEAGAMPDLDHAAYEALVQRKREELSSFLTRANVPEQWLSIHALVADWSGMAGAAANATAADYDSSRAWDGMADFSTSLRALAARRDELRLWSERRFLRAHLGKVRQSLDLNVLQTKLACESASNESEAISLQESRLKALLGNARADLNHRIATEVQAICQRGDANADVVKRLLSERLKGSLERWWDAQDAAVQSLADEFNSEIQHRHARPDWQAMAAMMGGIGSGPNESSEEKDSATRQRSEILRTAKTLQKAYLEAAPLVLDMPLSQARAELNRLRQAGSFQEYARQSSRRKNVFRDSSHADRANKMLKIETSVMVALPTIIELVSMVGEHQAEAKAAEQRIARRAALQAKLDQAAELIIGLTWQQWHDEGMAAVFSSALGEAHEGATARVNLLQQQRKSVQEAVLKVQTVLGDAGGRDA